MWLMEILFGVGMNPCYLSLLNLLRHFLWRFHRAAVAADRVGWCVIEYMLPLIEEWREEEEGGLAEWG